MEEERQYRKMSLIRTIIIITVVVLLVLWFIFFLKLSFKPEEKKDTSYNNNLSLMKEAAKNYFTEEVIKEDKMISLKEMYELKLLNTLKTNNDEECVDFASYAQIKENDTGYQLQVTLVCGDNNQTVIENIDLNKGE